MNERAGNTVSSFTVEIVPGTRIVRLGMAGMFSPDDAAALMKRFSALVDKARFEPETFDVLADVTRASIQAADIVQGLSSFFAGGAHRPARIAVVHGNTVIKLQARRVSNERGWQLFTTEEEARLWLHNVSLP